MKFLEKFIIFNQRGHYILISVIKKINNKFFQFTKDDLIGILVAATIGIIFGVIIVLFQ